MKKFPQQWSISVLKPLYKGGKKPEECPRSYRPVSLLSATSRIMEGILASQMNSFAEETGLIHPSVHGYRDGMSTVTALVEIQTRLVNSMESGNLSSLCLLDVSPGFDTVSNIYLLRKLELYGYSDSSLEWMASYLGNRSQQVQVQASTSESWRVTIGFPQGGPMSLILFREYGNDIPACMIPLHHSWRQGDM